MNIFCTSSKTSVFIFFNFYIGFNKFPVVKFKCNIFNVIPRASHCFS